jgi:hypothetical protein
LYPNPDNCNSFIQCVPQPDGSGKPQVMPCPDGLEWNNNKKECDWPQDSTCPKNSTQAPTAAPTQAPTDAPTEAPTEAPTNAPTDAPTQAPTDAPTEAPTEAPTDAPTGAPTEAPTDAPTDAPTKAPTEAPTDVPTGAPTEAPTDTPTEAPTEAPTDATTKAPTEAPTDAPTEAPTTQPPDCGDDDGADDNLNLDDLCSGCSARHLVANPNSQQRYIECSSTGNRVQKCSPGLLFDSKKLTCDYAGLVNPSGS